MTFEMIFLQSLFTLMIYFGYYIFFDKEVTQINIQDKNYVISISLFGFFFYCMFYSEALSSDLAYTDLIVLLGSFPPIIIIIKWLLLKEEPKKVTKQSLIAFAVGIVLILIQSNIQMNSIIKGLSGAFAVSCIFHYK